MRRVFVGALLVLASARCTLLSGAADLEAVQAGTDTRDGSLVAPNDAGAGATKDVASQPPVDAGTDVANGPTKNFCDDHSTSTVCLDFDSKSLDPSQEKVLTNATLTVDVPGHDSGHSLHCVGQDGLVAECFQVVPLPASVKKLHYRFDVLVESPGQEIEVNEIEFTYDTGGCVLQPSFVGTAVQVNEYCPGQGLPDQIDHDVATLDSATVPAWYTFDITLDLANHSLSGSFSKPGATLPFGPFTLDPRFLTSPKVAFHPGMTFGGKATPGAKIRTDNIALDLP